LRRKPAGSLSGGQQQMLAIGRALMARPRLLLLDEPSMGLAPVLVEQIMSTLQTLRRQGLAILLVEQNVQAALSIADRGFVMETGTIATAGSASELMSDERVRAAYLGLS
jgi:branched-chain amino acid transport system ATP-binding protein